MFYYGDWILNRYLFQIRVDKIFSRVYFCIREHVLCQRVQANPVRVISALVVFPGHIIKSVCRRELCLLIVRRPFFKVSVKRVEPFDFAVVIYIISKIRPNLLPGFQKPHSTFRVVRVVITIQIPDRHSHVLRRKFFRNRGYNVLISKRLHFLVRIHIRNPADKFFYTQPPSAVDHFGRRNDQIRRPVKYIFGYPSTFLISSVRMRSMIVRNCKINRIAFSEVYRKPFNIQSLMLKHYI